MFLQRFCISYKRKWKWWGGCYGVCINKELWNYNISYITWTWQCNVDGKKEKNKYKHLAMWIASICSKLPKGWHLPTCKRKGQNSIVIRSETSFSKIQIWKGKSSWSSHQLGYWSLMQCAGDQKNNVVNHVTVPDHFILLIKDMIYQTQMVKVAVRVSRYSRVIKK